ncbi:hypothetical protein P7K49_020985 [Saguinus oedipus]|uniref:Receptor ligand binding region domain-containing protein n=1 Tax=Saguinus oedipus TaxID=9490 RepID=A0ABQ9UTP4_SAGOE|nr:hypothetical protein P7K49_020985 [Saguinus oedipus]
MLILQPEGCSHFKHSGKRCIPAGWGRKGGEQLRCGSPGHSPQSQRSWLLGSFQGESGLPTVDARGLLVRSPSSAADLPVDLRLDPEPQGLLCGRGPRLPHILSTQGMLYGMENDAVLCLKDSRTLQGVAGWELIGTDPHHEALRSLLNLEKLLRQFLISKDTLSVRMLDDTRDPTPLLKEIRDDKTATIIIHANASMSHTILLKAAELGMVSAYYTYIFTNLIEAEEQKLTRESGHPGNSYPNNSEPQENEDLGNLTPPFKCHSLYKANSGL